MKQSVETLRRGLEILALIQGKGPVSQADIVRETGLSKAVVHRLVHTLKASGFVRVSMGDQLWRATGGPGLDSQVDPPEALARAALPVLTDLCEIVFWPSDVAIYSNGAMRIVEHTRRNTPFIISRIVAPRLPVLPSGLGRAVLAWSTPEDRERMLRDLRQSKHPRDAQARDAGLVERLIDETRERGYANRDPTHFAKTRRIARISEIAVPIMVNGSTAASISLCWATSALSEAEFVQENLPFLRAAAEDIAARLAGA